ncbi:hypothetical protein ACFPRL_21465 [Pseudoclavibacter helvolus]
MRIRLPPNGCPGPGLLARGAFYSQTSALRTGRTHCGCARHRSARVHRAFPARTWGLRIRSPPNGCPGPRSADLPVAYPRGASDTMRSVRRSSGFMSGLGSVT